MFVEQYLASLGSANNYQPSSVMYKLSNLLDTFIPLMLPVYVPTYPYMTLFIPAHARMRLSLLLLGTASLVAAQDRNSTTGALSLPNPKVTGRVLQYVAVHYYSVLKCSIM